MGQKQKRRFDDIFIDFFASPVISTNHETGQYTAINHWPPHSVTTLQVTYEHPFSVADHLKGKTVLPSPGAVPWCGGEACVPLWQRAMTVGAYNSWLVQLCQISLSERGQTKKHPGSPGWGFSAGLTTLPCKTPHVEPHQVKWNESAGKYCCTRGPKRGSFGQNQVSELKIFWRMRFKLKQQQITTHEEFHFSVQLTKKTCHY